MCLCTSQIVCVYERAKLYVYMDESNRMCLWTSQIVCVYERVKLEVSF